MTRRTAVFGYGSLVATRSAAQTLGRPMPDPLPAELCGWRRRWSLNRDNLRSEKTFAIEPGGEIPASILGLNLERDGAGVDGPNGVLIELTESELERLDLREMRYDRVEVTREVLGGERFDRIFTYTAKTRHFCGEPPSGSVILSSYASVVEAGFRALGDGSLEAYRRTTGPHPVAVVDGVLIRGEEIPPGNPRAW
ncbi:MAG: gamma-glutamylcyclotransferase family protein [Solirubrobacterales bacterium]